MNNKEIDYGIKKGEYIIATRYEIGKKYQDLITPVDAKIIDEWHGYYVIPAGFTSNSNFYNNDFGTHKSPSSFKSSELYYFILKA